MPAMAASDCSNDVAMARMSMPAPRPRVKMAASTASSRAISGVPRKSRTLRRGLALSGMKMSASALPIISTTGSSTVASVTAKVGRRTVRRSTVVAALPAPPDVPSASSPVRREPPSPRSSSNRCGAGTSTQRAA
jgi:hypothetical protein